MHHNVGAQAVEDVRVIQTFLPGGLEFLRLDTLSGGVLEAVVDIRGQSRRLVLLDLTAGGEGGFLRLDLLRLGDKSLVGAGAVVQLVSEQTFQSFDTILSL